MNRNEVSEAIVHDLGALFEAEVHGGASVVDSGSGRDGPAGTADGCRVRKAHSVAVRGQMLAPPHRIIRTIPP